MGSDEGATSERIVLLILASLLLLWFGLTFVGAEAAPRLPRCDELPLDGPDGEVSVFWGGKNGVCARIINRSGYRITFGWDNFRFQTRWFGFLWRRYPGSHPLLPQIFNPQEHPRILMDAVGFILPPDYARTVPTGFSNRSERFTRLYRACLDFRMRIPRQRDREQEICSEPFSH